MNQALPQRLRGLEKYRLEALIDGIFAVALTLLVLDIRLPDNIVVATNADLLDRLPRWSGISSSTSSASS